MARPKWRFVSFLFCLPLAASACDPYHRLGDDNASLGPVDPLNFPPANLGVGGDRTVPGRGTFTEIPAFADGAQVGYFTYAVPATAPDPLRLREDGKPYSFMPVPTAYVFDPAGASPIPAQSPCTPPQGWSYDPRRDDVRYDEQGNIFTALPRATYAVGAPVTSSYVPIVAQAPVSAAGRPCQKLKSAKALAATLGLPAPAGIMTDDKYLAWLVIEPAAGVYPAGQSASTHPGLGLQRWGWFNRYLLAYLDGGYIPTEPAVVMEGPAMKGVTRMRPQRLYTPRSMVLTVTAMGSVPTAGRMGAGYDVLQARRGDGDYSPLCAVFTYDAGMPLAPADLPKDAAIIEATFNTMEAPLRPATPALVYCLQVR